MKSTPIHVACNLLVIGLLAAGLVLGSPSNRKSDPCRSFQSVSKPAPASSGASASCSINLLKEGDSILGGFRKEEREPGDFDPNTGPVGPHVSPDVLRNRMFYYYFEVAAAIGNIGNHDDWTFNQSVDRSGWFTLDMGDGKESGPVDMAFHRAADNPSSSDSAWDSKGYHYAIAHGIPIEWPANDGKVHPVKNADITWKFTVTGYHESAGGVQDVVCAPLTFSLHLMIKYGQPAWQLVTQ